MLCGREGVSYKVINGVDISNPNIFFVNEEWENLPGWERREIQQNNDRKHAISKRITETRNNYRKTVAVDITTEKQSVVETTITGFWDTHRSQNEAGSSSGNPHINSIISGSNKQSAVTANRQAYMGGQNANNRDDMSQISYDHFGKIINMLH